MKVASNELIEIKALKPFAGSYEVSEAEHPDIVDDVVVTDELTGQLTKRRVARKRFVGRVPVQRRAWPNELMTWRERGVPKHVETLNPLSDPEVWVIERAESVKVPEKIAADLISRGLAIAA